MYISSWGKSQCILIPGGKFQCVLVAGVSLNVY